MEWHGMVFHAFVHEQDGLFVRTGGVVTRRYERHIVNVHQSAKLAQ